MQKHGSRTDQEESIMENYIRKLPGKQYLVRLEKNPTVIIPTGACEVYGPCWLPRRSLRSWPSAPAQ